MSLLFSKSAVGVIGAGAMGAGIAQVAAAGGNPVLLADMSATMIERAREGHARSMTREVEKGRLSRAAADKIQGRISYLSGGTEEWMSAFARCPLVIEAIVEEMGAKKALFRALETVVGPDTVLASNTSSLSIAAIAGSIQQRERVIGVHFFNPAPVMPLVEIIPSITTNPGITALTVKLVSHWGKTTVVASDTPGFIVNRIARPFYGESLRMLEEGLADCATIDWAMREIGGFRMGPFELMDFIGNDVNFAVTSSVFEAMFYDPRYRPALTQRRLVESGLLGRKSGRGYFDYRDNAPRSEPDTDRELGRAIVDRVLTMLINEAADALFMRVASAADIELSMTKGVNYPRGLLAWGDQIGAGVVLQRMDALYEAYREDRYRASPLLRSLARDEGKFLS